MLTLCGYSIKAQTEQCGTVQNLNEMIKKDPSLKGRMELNETKTQEWLKNNSRLKYANSNTVDNNEKKNIVNRSVMGICGYDNAYFTTITASTVLNQIVSPSPNCTYGGEYVRVNGLVAGNIYRISTCGANNFDTQLAIYTAGGGQSVAYNDDWCGSQSEIIFNPLTSGNYDILVDQYGCYDTAACAELAVELIYTPRPVITIPVVVHVMHNGESIGIGPNISTAQIQSQIDVLNEDYRRLNTDIGITPAAFRGISDDALVEFCLAQQDDLGNPTNGIERINCGVDSLTNYQFETIVKPQTIWNRDSYLNLWTCQFGFPDAGLLGYAQFPNTGSANTDGVVISYHGFGNTGSAAAPYDLGRTACHEVGHWLDLRHIWGDDQGDIDRCAGSDLVDDTPNQKIACGGMPTFPKMDSCSVNYPGIMFYNNMDYSDDATLTMFTVGQTARMDAALFGPRASLLSSLGCHPSTVSINESNFANSIQVFPNPSNGIFTLKTNFNREQNISINIFNILGEKVFGTPEEKITNDNIVIDLGGKSAGVYFIHINSGAQSVVKKIVVNKSN